MYDVLRNPSDTLTMVATLRIPNQPAQTFRIPPGNILPVVGTLLYELWTLRWRERKLSDMGGYG